MRIPHISPLRQPVAWGLRSHGGAGWPEWVHPEKTPQARTYRTRIARESSTSSIQQSCVSNPEQTHHSPANSSLNSPLRSPIKPGNRQKPSTKMRIQYLSLPDTHPPPSSRAPHTPTRTTSVTVLTALGAPQLAALHNHVSPSPPVSSSAPVRPIVAAVKVGSRYAIRRGPEAISKIVHRPRLLVELWKPSACGGVEKHEMKIGGCCP